MRINPYFYILRITKQINYRGHPVIFYLHPWEFDAEHEKIDLPFNRKFMRYCNIKSTEKKIRPLLERLEFSTVENVLGLSKTDKQRHVLPVKHDKYYDAPYFKSVLLTSLLILSIYAFLFAIAFLAVGYAVLLIIIFATIFYWPWGLLFTKINALFHRNQFGLI